MKSLTCLGFSTK